MSLPLVYAGFFRLDVFPQTFVPGSGLTGFKVGAEYFLSACNIVLAIVLYRQASTQKDYIWLTTGCLIMALSTYFFAHYGSPSDVHLLLGHCYKIAAYGCIYRATFLSALKQPQEKLEASNRVISELKIALDAHAILAITDAKGVIIHVNQKFCEISQYAEDELLGKTHAIINSGQHSRDFFTKMWKTIGSGNIWAGEICNRAKDGSFYWVQTTIVPFFGTDHTAQKYIAIRADITSRKKAEQNFYQLAFYDSLTGLPNQRLMSDRLKQTLSIAKREASYGGLLFIDLDEFKEINNTLGHSAGDNLLKDVAERLNASIRPIDTAARLGGDEFILILNGLGKDKDTARAIIDEIANKVFTALQTPHINGHYEFSCTASIGAMLFYGPDVGEAEDILKCADIAMYESKTRGRNCITHFNPDLQLQIDRRNQLLSDLRHALSKNELVLYYQPLVNKGGDICGAEALLRWQHGERGMIPPGEFIELAEQSGLIIPIGNWVLQQACEQLVKWQEHTATQHWSIAVNVSARQFKQPDYTNGVISMLNQTGAAAGLLRLELTESMLLTDKSDTLEKMNSLTRLGIRFSLDDFGTGYSSLSYLKQLPFHYLKIDRSFTNDLLNDSNAAAVVNTILTLAKTLNMQVVAEGVESAQQMKFLSAHDCDFFQGYLFGKPMPVAALEKFGKNISMAPLTKRQTAT